MSKLSCFVAILILSFSIKSQQPVEANVATGETRGGSKVELPPEKKKPIVIPKASTVPVIDGRPDEEIWKQAAVFKDFYQTNRATILHRQSLPRSI